KKKGCQGGCASCAPTAGAPVHVANTKPELVEKSPVVWTRPLSHGIPTVTVRPEPPMAAGQQPQAFGPNQSGTPYWMPGVPTSSERPTPYSPSSSQSSDGYKIQPSNYLPPLPPQR